MNFNCSQKLWCKKCDKNYIILKQSDLLPISHCNAHRCLFQPLLIKYTRLWTQNSYWQLFSFKVDVLNLDYQNIFLHFKMGARWLTACCLPSLHCHFISPSWIWDCTCRSLRYLAFRTYQWIQLSQKIIWSKEKK